MPPAFRTARFMVSRRRGGSRCGSRNWRSISRTGKSNGAGRRSPTLSMRRALPTQAATAFAKSCGVAVGELSKLTTEKGAWLQFRGTERGAATTALLGDIFTQAIAALPIAKRMRWGAHSAEFVRPVHSVRAAVWRRGRAARSAGACNRAGDLRPPLSPPKPISLKSAKGYEAGCAAPRWWRTSPRAAR